jgi:hypothetical protein
MKNKPYPALCKDCKWSVPESSEHRSSFNLCTHPKVVAKDNWALAANFEGKPYGSSCSEERRKTGFFVACGAKGKLWESKE